MPDKKRIGVFGGTFSPIHIGHLRLAEEAYERMDLDKVLFMPTNIQPFKQNEKYLSADDRLRMIKLAIIDNPHFDISTVELDREGVSYTIFSLREIRESLGDETQLYFVMGTDMFLMVEKWYLADELLNEFDIIVGVRPGDNLSLVEMKVGEISEKYGTDVRLIDNPPLDISSTEIRLRRRIGKSTDTLMPLCIEMYLDTMAKESESRFAHTKRVMDLAVEMAEMNDVDVYKTMIASLFHDFEKDSSSGIENNLNHGKLAAEIAKMEYGIDDEDILNAIRYHTTGRAGMSKLELIIFLADTLEPARQYQSIDELRRISLEDLRIGALTVLLELEKYLLKQGMTVSEDTEAAIADLSNSLEKN